MVGLNRAIDGPPEVGWTLAQHLQQLYLARVAFGGEKGASGPER